MPEPRFTSVAADQTTDMLRQVAATTDGHTTEIEAVSRDIAQLPLLAVHLGWSGSVLVDLIGRCQKIKDAAAAAGGSHPSVPNG